VLEQAWEEIYIPEGSDWFWWYYSHNNPAGENLFDREFRGHLANVYRLIGVPIPRWLREPIVVSAGQPPVRQVPRGLISPRLAAEPTAPADWAPAGYVEPELSGGAMQRSASHFRRLWYGFDRQNLYFRLELDGSLPEGSKLAVYLSGPSGATNQDPPFRLRPGKAEVPDAAVNWEVSYEDGNALLGSAAGQGVWQPIGTLPHAVGEDVWEVALPLAELGTQWGDLVSTFAVLARDGVVVEALPASEAIGVLLREPEP